MFVAFLLLLLLAGIIVRIVLAFVSENDLKVLGVIMESVIKLLA